MSTQQEHQHLSHVDQTIPVALTRVAGVTRWMNRYLSTGRKWDQNCARTNNLTSLPQNVSTHTREDSSQGHYFSGSSAMGSICPESGCAIHHQKVLCFALHANFLATAKKDRHLAVWDLDWKHASEPIA